MSSRHHVSPHSSDHAYTRGPYVGPGLLPPGWTPGWDVTGPQVVRLRSWSPAHWSPITVPPGAQTRHQAVNPFSAVGIRETQPAAVSLSPGQASKDLGWHVPPPRMWSVGEPRGGLGAFSRILCETVGA